MLWFQLNFTICGPCSKRLSNTKLEYDYASCFVDVFWPPSASSWIDICNSLHASISCRQRNPSVAICSIRAQMRKTNGQFLSFWQNKTLCTQWIPRNSSFLTCSTLAWIITSHSDTGHIYLFVDKIKVKLTWRLTIFDEHESCRSREVYRGCKGDSPGKYRWHK